MCWVCMGLTEGVREIVESAMEGLKGAARRWFMAEYLTRGYSDASVVVIRKFHHHVVYHESVHTWQARLLGPCSWPTVWSTEQAGRAVGATAGAALGIPLDRAMKGGVKRNSPYEAWAYSADNDPQGPDMDDDRLGWW